MIDDLVRKDLQTISKNTGHLKKRIKNNTFLVTGGAGFIGSWFCDSLNHFGAKIICIDDLSSGSKENIAHLMKNQNFKFIQCDVVKPFELSGKIDYIIHMASIASVDYYQKEPIKTTDANTIGTKNMLELAKIKNVKGFLFTSTSEIYGDAKIMPTPEAYRGDVNCTGIRSCYDEGKRCGEAYCMAYFRKYKVPVRIARIFNTYGPRLKPEEGNTYGRVIPRFIEQAKSNKDITVFGKGSQTRSFCYITDQIEGLLKLLLTDNLDGEVVNIGNDKETTILELAKMTKKLTNSSSKIVFNSLPEDDPKRRCPDVTKAKKLLNWSPKVSLESGLKQLI